MSEKIIDLSRVQGDKKQIVDALEIGEDVEPSACVKDRNLPNQICTKFKQPPIKIRQIKTEDVDFHK